MNPYEKNTAAALAALDQNLALLDAEITRLKELSQRLRETPATVDKWLPSQVVGLAVARVAAVSQFVQRNLPS